MLSESRWEKDAFAVDKSAGEKDKIGTSIVRVNQEFWFLRLRNDAVNDEWI